MTVNDVEAGGVHNMISFMKENKGIESKEVKLIKLM